MRITFTSTHPPLELPDGSELARGLTTLNSPVLFGCRTGICGTCLCEVTGEAEPPSDNERELLEILAPDRPSARLACQLRAQGDLALHYLGRD